MNTQNTNITPPTPQKGQDDGNNWARPMPVGRARYIRSWLILLAFLCFLVAISPFLNKLYWSFRNASYDTAAPVERSEENFLAISYEGVAAEKEPSGSFILTEHFRSHLEALDHAGYTPITIEDVRAFYENGVKLPKKALLMTFENTHRATYFETRNMLAKLRWHAAMGVVVAPVEEKNDSVILTPYLKDMAQNRAWNLVSQSTLGTTTITTSPQNARELFFASPMWIASSNRYERLEEFRARIYADHAASCAWFQKNLGTNPPAFFFPKGNYGQFTANNRGLREENLAAVEKFYGLGFILNQNAYNDANSDPRRLNRLSIDPKWSAKELLERLDNFWPAQAPRRGDASYIANSRWFGDWGSLHTTAADVNIRATPASNPTVTDSDATTGARAWISGSNGFREGSLETSFQLIRGSVHFYLHFASDDEWVRLSITEGGSILLAESKPGQDVILLAEDTLPSGNEALSMHSLLISLAKDIAYVRVDNKLLFGGAVQLKHDSAAAGGLVGVGVDDPTPGLAYVKIFTTRLRTHIDRLITWDPELSANKKYIIEQLQEGAFRYQIIATPWLKTINTTITTLSSLEDETLKLLARAARKQVFGKIELQHRNSLGALPPESLCDQIEKRGLNGIFVDALAFPPNELTGIRDWLTGLNKALNKRSLQLALRVPLDYEKSASLGDFIGRLDNAILINSAGGSVRGIVQKNIYAFLELPPPIDENNLEFFYQLSEFNGQQALDDSSEPARRKKIIRAVAAGEFDTAIAACEAWTKADPENSDAWAFAANAYARVHNREKAIDAYKKAIELEPGDINLVLDCVKQLEQANRNEEARVILDLYARTFPDNIAISLEQAKWLNLNNNRAGARDLLISLVTNKLDSTGVRVQLQEYLVEPQHRYENLHAMLRSEEEDDTKQLAFANDIRSAELLTFPESSVFFSYIRDTAEKSPRENIRKQYSEFLPLQKPIFEEFDISHISENWIPLGTMSDISAGAYSLRALSNMSEAYLRLKHSELIRDGFIRVTLGESIGAFWIYARRCSRSMIRFGFDGDGFLRIQSWINGEARTMDSRAWVRPTGDITLCLEIRGDGAIGLVDGKEMFNTPLQIPEEVAYGWWSVAPFSPELGVARARIRNLSAGPLAPSIVLMRENELKDIDQQLSELRPYIRQISAISPVCFVQTPDGDVLSTASVDLMPFRMFCKYHRIRLLPIVSLDYFSEVNPETLVKIIKENRLSGLVLRTRSVPPEAWFAKMEKQLEQTEADLIVVQSESDFWEAKSKPFETMDAFETHIKALAPTYVRELQRGSVLLPPNQVDWTLQATPLSAWSQNCTNAIFRESATPSLVILPTQKLQKAPKPAATETATDSAPEAPSVN